MKKLMIALITVLFFAVNGDAGELLLQDDSAKAVQQADTASQAQDANNPENSLPTKWEVQIFIHYIYD